MVLSSAGILIVVADGWVSSEKGMGRIDVFRVGVIGIIGTVKIGWEGS